MILQTFETSNAGPVSTWIWSSRNRKEWPGFKSLHNYEAHDGGMIQNSMHFAWVRFACNPLVANRLYEAMSKASRHCQTCMIRRHF